MAAPRGGAALHAPASVAAAPHGTVRLGRAAVRRSARRPASPPVRLTRRGRIVVAGLAVVIAGATAALLSLALAGGALAAGPGSAGPAGAGMHQVVVTPGQTLWSIASAADPSADPRVVVQEIIQANSLPGATIQAGQLLWVPKN
jgi:hypothetical protein